MTVSPASPMLHVDDRDRIGQEFRTVLGHFCTGVVIVTALDAEGGPVGMTVGSFTSVSLDPPLVGFFAGQSSTTLPHITAAGSFCVNVLAEHQNELARSFARSGADKFGDVDWHRARGGSPRLSEAHAWIDCTLHDGRPYGDHDLIVGEVVGLSLPVSNPPLVFHQAKFHGLREL
ncbi:flavin reductase family protein [Gordonia caeni]|uniref:Flavin reductase family protein n=1 Tax=Gordonia caeni TaxID=1007097 RepID=A0ABP7NXS9_9ACTN